MNTIQYIIRPSPVTTIQAGTGADPLREAQAQNIEIQHTVIIVGVTFYTLLLFLRELRFIHCYHYCGK